MRQTDDTISQTGANATVSRGSHGGGTAEQEHIRGLGSHETQRTGGGYAQALATAQADLGPVEVRSGFTKGDDHGGFILRTGLEAWATTVQPQEVGLHTVIVKQAALIGVGTQAAHGWARA